ncbi:MmgE/PrpD family protein [Rhodopila sp.]|uniref:MmgE/PrpD family protein n=1 Tax=Rhodopila sp. TaxID=2480087 RepID=UPI003D10ED04
MPNAAEVFATHVTGTELADIPAEAIDRAKIFILDTLGVGIAGSSAYGAAALLRANRLWGDGTEASVWGRRDRVPAPAAALLNAFQVHCQEYDCVCEPAVLHPMATLLPAALAFAERQGGVSGNDLLAAVILGVDVSAGLGIASTQGLRFFRPATAGGFGAAAAVARLARMDAETIVNVLGIQYAQTSGTMQAHVEASTVLPMQVGFNARAALQSCDIARTGLTAPRGSIDGPYGYLPLMEGGYDLQPVLDGLGRDWRVMQLSHKPFPSGRATHGAIEGVQVLRQAHGFTPEEVAAIDITVPPLTARLIARPDMPNPVPNYARLCTAFVVAKVLRHGTLDLAHLRGDALNDPDTHRLAALVQVHGDGNPDPNAMVPQDVRISLRDGRVLDWHCDAMLANSSRPWSRDAHLAKFRRCWQFAADPLPEDRAEALIRMVDRLEDVADLRSLIRLLVA